MNMIFYSKILWLTVILYSSLYFCGCRTYVGSSDIKAKSDPVDEMGQAVWEQKQYGFELKVNNGQCHLLFGHSGVLKFTRSWNEWIVGRRYFYLQKEYFITPEHKTNSQTHYAYQDHKNRRKKSNTFFISAPESGSQAVAAAIFLPIVYPLCWIMDSLHLGSSWHLAGDHLPGLGYMIAYLPPVSWLTAPFLRPPYTYKEGHYRTIENRWNRKDSLIRHETTVHRKVFIPEKEQLSVEISCKKGNLRKTISPDGTLVLNLRELEDVDPGKLANVEFMLYCPQRSKSWSISCFPLGNATELQSFNQFADENTDYWVRAYSFAKLSNVFAESYITQYLQKLLNGKKINLSFCPGGITSVKTVK